MSSARWAKTITRIAAGAVADHHSKLIALRPKVIRHSDVLTAMR